ncbi:MAG TPA: Pr6Pr family membrane protein [Rectinemataceae bacterium]
MTNSIVACLGLWLLFSTSASGRGPVLLLYFTTQTNIFAALLALALSVGTLRQILKLGPRGEAFSIHPLLQSGITLWITITFLVFATMLSGYLFSMGGSGRAAMILTHYVVPLMCFGDWLAFMPHGRLPARAALLWLLYPLAYLVFSLARAELGPPVFERGSRYPYFFMNADALGWGNMAWILPAFGLAFWLLGLGFESLDRRMGKRYAVLPRWPRTGSGTSPLE